MFKYWSQFKEGVLDEYSEMTFQEKVFSMNLQEINKVIKCLLKAALKISFESQVPFYYV